MTSYAPSSKDLDDLEAIFTFHPVSGDQPARYQALRAQAKSLALTIVALCPPSRERSVAITNLQQAVMWANAAIAINEAEEAR
jgi:hypothetical protein